MSNGNDNGMPVRRATPVDPGVTVARATPINPPPAAPTSTPASNWDQILQNAAPKYTGQPGGSTTVFATPKDLRNYARTGSLETGDNGVGAAALGGVDTAHSYGVAVPPDVLTKLYGGKASDPSTTANWRTARAQVTVNGKTYVVPISDLGPSGVPASNGTLGKGPRGDGRVTDLTSDLAKGIPGWMSDDSDGPVQIKLLPPGSGPDYLTERDKWNTEQQGIGKQLTPTPLGSTDIVRPSQPASPPKAQPVLSTAQADTDSDGTSLASADTDSDDVTGYTGPSLGGHLGAINA
jgi:hypothetical protein